MVGCIRIEHRAIAARPSASLSPTIKAQAPSRKNVEALATPSGQISRINPIKSAPMPNAANQAAPAKPQQRQAAIEDQQQAQPDGVSKEMLPVGQNSAAIPSAPARRPRSKNVHHRSG